MADGTMPETDQPFLSRNWFDKAHENMDSSIDSTYVLQSVGVNE